MIHLLCPLCAIRRGSKALKSYLDRWAAIQAEKPAMRPFLVTLTVKDGEDLSERFNHLFRLSANCGSESSGAGVRFLQSSRALFGLMRSNGVRVLVFGTRICT